MSKTSTTSLRSRITLTIASVMATVYVFCLVVRPPKSWPEGLRELAKDARGHCRQLIQYAHDLLGIETFATYLMRHAEYLIVTMALVPWIVMALMGRWRPADLGMRLPNRVGWRILVVGYVLALPFVIWMALSPDMLPYYQNNLSRGAAAYVPYFILNILPEHMFMHGVLLALLAPQMRWPAPATVDESATRLGTRVLQWLGFAQPVGQSQGLQRFTRWIGLPDGCVFAVLVSGFLFGLVHVGKDPRELLLSPLGGGLSAYIAYRCNSWLIPFLLHAAIAGTAALILIYGSH